MLPNLKAHGCAEIWGESGAAMDGVCRFFYAHLCVRLTDEAADSVLERMVFERVERLLGLSTVSCISFVC